MATQINDWNDLTWGMVQTNGGGYLTLGTFPNVTDKTLPQDASYTPDNTLWADDAAAMAMILYQNPVKVLIHANEMIP